MTSPATGPIAHHAVVQVRTAALHRRRWRSNSIARQRMACILFIREGTAQITEGFEQLTLIAPTVLLIPARQQLTVDIHAGCDCLCIGFSDPLISESVGNKAESRGLSRVAERLSINQSPQSDLLKQIETLVFWSDSELRDTTKQSWMCMAAYARLLLICVQRCNEDLSVDENDTPDLPDTIRRFRHLVELHYQEHWTIKQYAEAMGMTYERLHGLCRRELDSTPLRLVQQRLSNEAQLRLEHSGQSVKEIGALLGFPDAPTFSHFFKRMVGETPGRFRAMLSEQKYSTDAIVKPAFADWP